jgi:hypothetical protein
MENGMIKVEQEDGEQVDALDIEIQMESAASVTMKSAEERTLEFECVMVKAEPEDKVDGTENADDVDLLTSSEEHAVRLEYEEQYVILNDSLPDTNRKISGNEHGYYIRK